MIDDSRCAVLQYKQHGHHVSGLAMQAPVHVAGRLSTADRSAAPVPTAGALALACAGLGFKV